MFRQENTWKNEALRVIDDLNVRWRAQGANTVIILDHNEGESEFWLTFTRKDSERSLAHTTSVSAESWREITVFTRGFSAAVHMNEFSPAPQL